ncbi:O-antigen translocase [Algibacter lectus]|uniref:PST family polysaccharide transporter n=3 Tax=Algibacter lectus TaxID=221126 RepID=A0A4R8M3M3_9FLAO|nr:O-antigen translocase [Algibacter lectus]MDO7138305.1 O-antigen translocase [Algibacter lectus]MWW26612.1 oligosaccharide flippase family protein [Algibacter lectus]TDY59614.1 PST family polysaccharide transporter [Algibacter lectus]SFD61593.1 polysaccharide transporter, PST family [Algibacter lectus]
MKKLIDYIKKHVLIKLMSLKTVLVFVKVLAGILTSKAIALIIGPVGFALIGNLENFVSAFHNISVLGSYNTVVKYVALYKEDTKSLSKTLSTVFYVGFVSTVIVSMLCYLNAETINDFIFPKYNNYADIIKIFAIALPFYAINMYSFSIMNGFGKYKNMCQINIIGQLLSVAIALVLIYQSKIDGALISVVISESLIFLITLVGIFNRRSLANLVQVKNISFSFFKKTWPISIMALFSAVLMPLVAICIRSYIIEGLGYKEAGLWEAMNRISRYYLMFVTSIVGMSILPRLSKINNVKKFRKEISSYYKILVPILIGGFLVIYALKSPIISLVFTNEFRSVEDLFLWQLLGDFIKILAVIIAYQFLAKKMFWHYILTELFLVVILYITSVYFIGIFDGVKGAVFAHFVSYLMYFGIVILLLWSSLFGLDSNEISLRKK